MHHVKIFATIALLAAVACPCLAEANIASSAYTYYSLCHSATTLQTRIDAGCAVASRVDETIRFRLSDLCLNA